MWPDDPYGLGDFGLSYQRKPFRIADYEPAASEEEEKSLLRNLWERGAPFLQTVGEVLDKIDRPFRGLAGIATGAFQGDSDLMSRGAKELLAFVPFSDRFNLTDKANIVGGRELNEKWGWTDRGDDSIMGRYVKPIATEIMLSPTTWAMPGALTLKGIQAQKAGQLAGSYAGRMAAGQAGIARLGIPWMLRKPVEMATGANLRDIGFTLGSLSGSPILDPLKLKYAGAWDKAGSALLDNVLTRTITAPFRGGDLMATDPNAIKAIRPTYKSTRDLASYEMGQPLYDALASHQRTVNEVVSKMGLKEDEAISLVNRLATQVTEGHTPTMPFSMAGQDVPDWLKALIGRTSPAIRAAENARFDIGSRHGVSEANKWVSDFFDTQYLTREVGGGNKVRTNPSAIGRGLETDIEGGTVGFNDFLKDHPSAGIMSRPGLSDDARKAGVEFLREDIGRMVERGAQKFVASDDVIKLSKATDIFKRADIDPAKMFAEAENAILKRHPGISPTLIPNLIADEMFDKAVKLYRDRVTDFVANVPSETVGRAGKDFFDTDIIRNLRARLEGTAEKAGRSQSAVEFVKNMAKPLSDLGDIKDIQREVKNVPDIMKELGVAKTPDILAELGAKFGKPQIEGFDELSNLFVKSGDLEGIRKAVIPGAAFLDRLRDQFPKLIGNMEKATNVFRSFLVAPWPANFVRNVVDNLARLWRGGHGTPGLSDLKYGATTARSADILRPGTEAYNMAKLAFAGGLTGKRGSLTLAELGDKGFKLSNRPEWMPAGPGKSRAVSAIKDAWQPTEIPKDAGLLKKIKTRAIDAAYTPVNLGYMANQAMEESFRVASLRKLLKQGWEPYAAVREVQKRLGDYADMSRFEKDVVRAIVPFWGFTRSSVPVILEDLFKNPGRINQMVKVLNAGREKDKFLPNYIGEGTAIPLSGAPKGYERFLSSLGLSIEDDALKSLSYAFSPILSEKGTSNYFHDIQRAAQLGGGMLAPHIKAPLELMFGTQLFSGRKLEDLRPHRWAQALVGDNSAAQFLTQIGINTPAARAFTTLERMTDERKPWDIRALNLLTGARVTDVDIERTRAEEAKSVLTQLFKDSGLVREMSKPFIPEEIQEQMTPEQRRQYMVWLLLEKRAKDARDRARNESRVP